MGKQIVKYPFKIHALETVEDCLPCSNGMYYATEEEALERCHAYLQTPGQSTSGFVIFKAHTIVRPKARPVRVNRVNDDGSLGATDVGTMDDLSWLGITEEEEDE